MYTLYINELPEVVHDNSCTDNVHQQTDNLFGSNCKKCGEMPIFADDATYHVQTKTREQSQTKIKQALDKITTFLNSHDLTVNLPKTNILETLVKQKRTKLKGEQPKLETTNPDGTHKTIKPAETIILQGVNFQHNLTWNSHLHRGKKALIPEL